MTLQADHSGTVAGGGAPERVFEEPPVVWFKVIPRNSRHQMQAFGASAGDAGPQEGGAQFKVRIVAAAFRSMPILERHRLVYSLLEGAIGGSIQALALETRAPGEPPSS